MRRFRIKLRRRATITHTVHETLEVDVESDSTAGAVGLAITQGFRSEEWKAEHEYTGEERHGHIRVSSIQEVTLGRGDDHDHTKDTIRE